MNHEDLYIMSHIMREIKLFEFILIHKTKPFEFSTRKVGYSHIAQTFSFLEFISRMRLKTMAIVHKCIKENSYL